MFKLLLLAIFLRLLIMPFYFHPDIKTYNFQASFLKEGVWDIYSYLDINKEKLPLKDGFVYFPLTYIFLGSYQILASPFLGPGFTNWLSDASQQANDRIGVYRYLFILKLPYLLIDLAIAFILMRFFANPNDKKKAFIFWLFNPFSIALIYMYSNVDIIPVFFTTLSLLLTFRKKLVLAALFLGIAASFKAYPLLFLPFILLYVKNIKQGIFVVISCLGIFTIIIMPFLTSTFIQSTLVSGLTTRLVFPGLGIGFGQTLMAGVIAISALLFYGFLRKAVLNYIVYFYLSLLLLLFSFIHFHIQWLLWIIPFLVIILISGRKLANAAFFLISLAFVIPLLYEDKSMTVGLLSAISPLYNLLPIPFAAVSRLYDPYVVQSVLHSGFVGGSMVVIWHLFKDRQT